MCNSLAVTVLMTSSCLGISLAPRRVMHDSMATGEIIELVVEPAVPAHQTWICYQVEELGPGLQRVVTMIRQTANEKNLFLM